MSSKLIEVKNKLDEGLVFKISHFKRKIKKTVPHKHDDYNELILLKKGEGFHQIEEKQYLIQAPEYFILNPGQLHFWQFTSIPEGFVIMFKKNFFDLLKDYESMNLFNQLAQNVRGAIPANLYPQQLLDMLYDEFKQGLVYSPQVINGLLKSIIGKLLNIKSTGKKSSNGPASQFEIFQSLLINTEGKVYKVNYYAEKLNTTPQNLTNICKKNVDKTASELINEQIILEAKRLILHTDSSINEIAFQLNFSDVSNFVKFFKRFEGKTPLQYRKQYFQ
jgi:AraC-like DNA-binding protein